MDLSWLWGGDDETYQPGQFGKSRPFPSKEDLEFARKYGEFQHTGEYTPNTFQVEEATTPGKTMEMRELTQAGLFDPPTDQELIDTLARNKLASRRSAIVSLAANDPNDQVVGAKDFTYSGFAGKTYIDPKKNDPMWTFFGKENEPDPSTPTHEAAHRGMYKVVDEIERLAGDEPLPDEWLTIRDYYNNPDNNEYAVRALMHDLYNNVEEHRMPGEYKNLLNNPLWQDDLERARQMNQIAEAIAQKMVQRRKPGGPW